MGGGILDTERPDERDLQESSRCIKEVQIDELGTHKTCAEISVPIVRSSFQTASSRRVDENRHATEGAMDGTLRMKCSPFPILVGRLSDSQLPPSRPRQLDLPAARSGICDDLCKWPK